MSKKKQQILLYFIFILFCLLLGIGIGIYRKGDAVIEKNENNSEEYFEDSYSPLIEWFPNVLYLGMEDNRPVFCIGDNRVQYDCLFSQYIYIAALSEFDVVDLQITDGVITNATRKQQKLSGKVLEITDEYIELEKIGRVRMTEDFVCYSLIDEIGAVSRKNIVLGYEYTDFVMQGDKICAALIVRDGIPCQVRILLSNNADGAKLQEYVELTADCAYTVYEGDHETTYDAGQTIEFTIDASFRDADRIIVRPGALTGRISIPSIEKSCGTPAYFGSIELAKHEGGIAVVNEVDLEQYLLNVVPSEMPSYYHSEALKAQAICARTYAYTHILHAGRPAYGAHMDDTAGYQVYYNIKSSPECTKAVKDTKGQILLTAYGDPAETFYYSTSCGVGTDTKIWKTEAGQTIDYLNTFSLSKASKGEPVYPAMDLSEEDNFRKYILSENSDDYEYNDSFYRWQYAVEIIQPDLILRKLQERYQKSPKLILTKTENGFESKEIEKLGDICNITVNKRGANGVADEVLIEGTEGTYLVLSEGLIRSILSDDATTVLLKNGKKYACNSLLPSGFFVVECEKTDEGIVSSYTLFGGGFGHGVGMSQNGARRMAEDGWDCISILEFFYRHCRIEDMLSY